MKATELTIGDWVQVCCTRLNGEERITPPMRVVSIGESWVCTMIDPEQGDPFEDDIKDIRPIPITEEFLLKNGFEKVFIGRVTCEDVNGRFVLKHKLDNRIDYSIRIEFDSASNIWADIWAPYHSFRMPMNYIHQLQHAIMMTGIEKEIAL